MVFALRNYDVILIHPPRLLESNKDKNSKFIRGSYIFIPMGVFAIADYLEKEGFGVKIINFPLEQYLNHEWSLTGFLKNINFKICGIDLHWLHNAHGAIEVVKIVKEVNPNSKVIFGGYSASYYHDQLLKYYKEIDGVIRGEGEVPLLRYAQMIQKNQRLDSVPNLSYRNSSKQIKINPITYTAKNLDDLVFTNVSLLKNAEQYLNHSRRLMGIAYNLSIGRGCPFNCPFCGGGQRAQQYLTGRNNVIFRSPEKVIEDMSMILDNYKVPSFFFGHGTYSASLKYWKNLFALIQKEKFDIGGDLEIWRLPFPKEMWRIFHKTFHRKYSSISVSPRTLSPKVQDRIAKICDPTFKFPINQINDLIKNANLYQRTLRIWLTAGYPFQTRSDILKDFIYAMKCLFKYGKSNFKPISIYNEPFYIFPGSPAHRFPDKFGITLKDNSFLQVAEAFKNSKISFLYNVVNYDTEHLSGTSIRSMNKLFFLSTFLMFFTIGSNISEVRNE